jgi:hypothetical protein
MSDRNDDMRKLAELSPDTFADCTNGIITVHGNLDLENMGLTEIPMKVDIVRGDLILKGNHLKNLHNFPGDVYGIIDLSNNMLRSLEGCSHHAKSLILNNNPYLNTIEHAPYDVEVAENTHNLGLLINTRFKGVNIPQEEMSVYFACCSIGSWKNDLSIVENVRILIKRDPSYLNLKWSILDHPSLKTLVMSEKLGLI